MTRRRLFGYGSRFHAWRVDRRLRKQPWCPAPPVDDNGCRIVLDTKAEASYCETHHYPLLPGEADADHLEKARHP